MELTEGPEVTKGLNHRETELTEVLISDELFEGILFLRDGRVPRRPCRDTLDSFLRWLRSSVVQSLCSLHALRSLGILSASDRSQRRPRSFFRPPSPVPTVVIAPVRVEEKIEGDK